MPKPRKPTKLLELSGAMKRNPGRYANRLHEPKSNGPLGEPPDRMSAAEQSAWHELVRLVPDGVLTKADRWIVEIACRLMAAGREHGFGGRHGISAGEVGLLNGCLRSMGLTPADRSKVNVTGDEAEEANPFAELASEKARPN
jgi:phage terminase small subunit